MNICMVGYGMMGIWHSEALKKTNAVLHTVVGRRPDASKEFAERYGYKKWTVSLEEALADSVNTVAVRLLLQNGGPKAVAATALRMGIADKLPKVDPSKYQQPRKTISASTPAAQEMFTVRLRYKQPEGDTSVLREVPLANRGGEFAAASKDLRFAAAVASHAVGDDK